MTSLLRAGVIGAGVFGGYHAQKWAAFDGVRMAAVLDPHPDRAAEVAGRHGAEAIMEGADFFAAVDLVSIASPAGTHAEWALAALKAGKPVYVEKPLATRLQDAEAIAAAGARAGLTVACGFLERAAFAAIGLNAVGERPLLIEGARLGRSERNLDVSVVLDLMIHDLDLVLSLTRADAFAVEAESRGPHSGFADDVSTEISFDDGLVVRLHASRVAPTPERRMRIVFPSGDVEIDLLAGTLTNSTRFPLDAAFAQAPEAKDRLAASLAAFLACVRGKASAPMADAWDGVRALDLALAVEQALDEGPASPFGRSG